MIILKKKPNILLKMHFFKFQDIIGTELQFNFFTLTDRGVSLVWPLTSLNSEANVKVPQTCILLKATGGYT